MLIWIPLLPLIGFLINTFAGKRLPKKLSMKPVDAFTVEYTGKESGKATVTGRRIVSSDGKTMTLAGKSLIPSGEWIPFEAVFDKQ